MLRPQTLVVLASVLLVGAERSATAQSAGAIRGRVVDQQGAPIAGALVALVGVARSTYSSESGTFALNDLATGRYVLRAQRIGFAPSAPDSVTVAAGAVVERELVLHAVSIPLSRVVISPGSYTLLEPARTSQQVLTREQLLTRPQLAEDLFRSLNRLPGLSGSDFSAKLRVRNGGQEEILVLLDGMELIEPFHLKDFDGALSILDVEAVGRVDVKTGGFGAQYGNRLTGVLDLSSANATLQQEGRSRSSLGLSFTNVRARSEGRFAGDRGAWLASARRGYLDLVFKLIGEEDAPDPRYYDVFGKVQYQLNAHHLLAGHVLAAGDELRFSENDGATHAQSRYNNVYLWSTLQSQLGERLRVSSLVSLSHLTWIRDGTIADVIFGDPYERNRVNDDRQLDIWSAKQDWAFDATSRLSLLFGGEVRGEAADFAYHRIVRNYGISRQTVVLVDSQSVGVALAPSGTRFSGYGALRVLPWSRLTGEFGLRADRLSWTDETTVAPRLSVALEATPRTTVRAAFGFYHQGHSLQDLSVVDGDTSFASAERAEHRVLGVEQRIGGGWTLRSEVFERLIEDPRPRWYNTDGDIDVLIETQNDRLRLTPSDGHVRGVEWLATYDRGGSVRAGASYVFSKATATQSGVTTARPFDERHAVALDLSARTRSGWTWAFAWTMHSGWPLIPPTFRVDTLSSNQIYVRRVPSEALFVERLGAYQRFDVRLSRAFDIGRSRLSVFAEVFNVFDRENERGASYNAQFEGSNVRVNRFRETFLPRLPSLGIRWDF